MNYANEHQIETWHSDVSAHHENWKRDHDRAMECRECEDLIALGLSLLAVLKKSNSRWQDQVFRGTVPFDAGRDEAIRRAHALWVTTAEAIRTHLVDGLERQSYEVEGANQLRETIPEVQLAIQNWKPPRMSQNVAFRDYDVSDNDFADLQRLKENKACRPYTPKKRSASTQSPST